MALRVGAAKLAVVLLALLVTGTTANCPTKECGAAEAAGKASCKEAAAVDHAPLFAKNGAITKVNVYYAESTNCIKGVKPTYGYDGKNAAMIGSSHRSFEAAEGDLKLGKGEHITEVEVSAGGCIHFVKFTTNKGKTKAFGRALTKTKTFKASCEGGYLAAFSGAGVQGATAESTKCTPLQSLGFKWVAENCERPVQPAPLPAPVPEQPVVAPDPAPAPEPAAPACACECPAAAAAAAEKPTAAEKPAAAVKTDAAVLVNRVGEEAADSYGSAPASADGYGKRAAKGKPWGRRRLSGWGKKKPSSDSYAEAAPAAEQDAYAAEQEVGYAVSYEVAAVQPAASAVQPAASAVCAPAELATCGCGDAKAAAAKAASTKEAKLSEREWEALNGMHLQMPISSILLPEDDVRAPTDDDGDAPA